MNYLVIFRARRGRDHYGHDRVWYEGLAKDFYGARRGSFRVYGGDLERSFSRYRLLHGAWEMFERDGRLFLGQVGDGPGAPRLVVSEVA